MLSCGTSVKSAMKPAEIVADNELGFVTVTSLSVPGARVGVDASISVPLITATPVAATPPIFTVAPFWKLRPVIASGVGAPAGPDVGSRDVADGPGTARQAENSDVFPAASVA